MRTNLEPNSRWTVAEPLDVCLRIGIAESNTSFGSSMIYGNVYRAVTLDVDDVVYSSFGGLFVHHAGEWFEAALPKSVMTRQHPFLKSYDDPVEMWPVDSLDRIADDAGPAWTAPATRTNPPTYDLAALADEAESLPSGIDWLVA